MALGTCTICCELGIRHLLCTPLLEHTGEEWSVYQPSQQLYFRSLELSRVVPASVKSNTLFVQLTISDFLDIS